MAEQTFRSPGFFEQEIDLSAQVQAPVGIPAGVIGPAKMGPAFVPVTVGSLADFQNKFGSLDPNLFGPYAVNEWLKNRTALTYVRVLGAGANSSASDISTTVSQGTVRNAGFKLSPVQSTFNTIASSVGSVQFIVASHDPPADEAQGYPLFTDNSSVKDLNSVNLVRAMILTTSGSRVLVMDNTGTLAGLGTLGDPGPVGGQGMLAKVGPVETLAQSKYFKLIVSSTLSSFGTSENLSNIRVYTASLDPNDGSYIGKVLNTDPLKFGEYQHLLYSDLSVEHDLAPVKTGATRTVAVVSGSLSTSAASGDATVNFLNLFGRFDTRYTTARTTSFISQPFGKKEYDLFYFETLTDGESGNNLYKVSIANLRASTDPASSYGTFEVQVRNLRDTDTSPQILESYPNCSLDPQSDRYVARVIGDKKVYYDFDQENLDERRLVVSGKYPNISNRIRIVMNRDVENNLVPANALPFGFRGIPTLKTTDSLTDKSFGPSDYLKTKDGRDLGSSNPRRLSGDPTGVGHLTCSIVPPIPHRVKVTRGPVASSGFLGQPGSNERVDSRFYWGISTTRIPVSSSTDPALGTSDAILRPNEGFDFNSLVSSYSKFVGIQKLDALVTGTAADEFNDNKFSLAKVATSQTGAGLQNVFAASVFTGSADQIMLETAYIRNAAINSGDYTITDGTGYSNRYTLASLIATSSVLFNRFTPYAKFTNIFYGGFDGLDITDKDRFYFRDRALSSDTGGKAESGYRGPLDSVGAKLVSGDGRLNNNVASVNTAVGIITDPFNSNINLLAIPGVRDSFVTDNALSLVRDNGQIMYVMDLIKYDSSGARLYDDSVTRPDPAKISEQFEGRALDNSYGATFFPDVNINDTVNSRIVKVPSSVAALGVLGFNDNVAFPWFAPAGFNRGALGFVTNVETRLSQEDRDTLYDARINPIAVFPTGGFVVFGQKTLQQAKSALDRINVRRLLLEVKRVVGGIAQQLLFEPNNSQTRARLVGSVVPQLALIQAQQGIESFKVICDDTNNTSSDVEANKLNGRIVIVPTRTIEFISIDFIVTNSGVQFL